MFTFEFRCSDNGGKKQFFKVKANDKTTAIKKAFAKASKAAKGDIYNWECRLLNMM